ALGRFFADRPVPDVAAWSRDLVATGLTFDTWVFPEQDASDLRSVSVTSFTNAQGAVVTTSKLSQPDGPGTPLIAQVGPGAKLVVRWVSDPVKTPALHGWVAAIQPATDDAGADVAFLDLPSKQTKGTTRSATLSLNIDLDEPPDTGFRVRVVAVDASGNEVTGADTSDPIAALSDEFYLVTSGGLGEGSTKTSVKKRSVTTLAEGRIAAVLETKEKTIALTEPMWSVADDLVTFTLRADPRQTMTLTFSPFLLELERRTLADPRSGGRWSLSVSEVLPAAVESCQPGPRIAGHSGVWSAFWDARDRFFAVVRGNDTQAVGPPYPCVETFAWDDDAIARAVAYAKSYERLLTTVHGDDLADALSIDTLCVACDAGRDPERSVVVLPTHPLRTLWSASHAALLRHWEGSLMEMAPAERKRAIDLQLLGRLRPTNMPAFARDWDDGSTHVFFRNLGGSHGVALPAGVPDPMRRFIDLARITGWERDTAEPDDDGPRRLARHLERFRELHPYADPFRLALVNPDQGAYVAEALDTLLRPAIPADQTTTGDEDRTLTPVPMLDIAAYFDESQTRQGSLHGIERLRQRRGEWQTRHASDHLYPALSASIQSLSTLTGERPEDSPDAHVAMVTDLCQPEVHTRPRGTDGPATSLALHGLIARFLSDVSIEGAGVRWDYRIATTTDGAGDHPAGGELGTGMVTLQSALYDAWGRSLLPGSTVAVEPVLRVSLQERQIDLLETLHDNADWVLTIDRFFGVEYYDSPNIPAFRERAEKHLIDYSPEFVDGLGHRMIVTTAWREEVTTILRRAMTELGFGAVDSSVRVLLRHLKSVSGRLALRTLEANSGGASAVSLAAVMAWLEARAGLRDTLLVPIDVHQ
ncbi:MAG: hypothetical protein M3440_05600, partial [Chloroflexota bacterium]|nr:hypothetical protein [Chloroflexota bacterium]